MRVHDSSASRLSLQGAHEGGRGGPGAAPGVSGGDGRRHEPSRLPGRDAELAHASVRCGEGHGGILWTGDPGTGRSALLAGAAHRARRGGAIVVTVPVPTPEGERSGDDEGPYAFRAIVAQLAARMPTGAVGPERPARPRRASGPSEGSGEDADGHLLGRTLAALAHAVAGELPIVLVADDLDALDPVTRTAMLTAVAERQAPVVLLATAGPDGVPGLPYAVESRALPPIDALAALELVRETTGEAAVAPHVVQHLLGQLAGAPTALVETAQLLTAAQLAGLSLVPDPLPAAPSVRRAVAGALGDCPDEVRSALLVAAVSVVDTTDVLLRAVGTDIGGLVRGPAAHHLHMVAGHARLTDPRIRSVVHADATVAERTRAHERLAEVHAEDGSTALSTWHAALAALAGAPALAEPLLDVAERMLARGDAVWAQRVALEALSHATGTVRVRAVALAGRAALHAGHLADAIDLLRTAERAAGGVLDEDVRPALTLAISLLAGGVPDGVREPDAPLPAHLVAVVLHAERGDVARARVLLRAARRRYGTAAELVDLGLAEAWVDLLSGRPQTAAALDPATGVGHPTRTAIACGLRALALGALDRTAEATSVLTAARAGLARIPGSSAWADPDVHGAGDQPRGSLTPLAEAHLGLVEALVGTWAGDVRGARARLQRASLVTPVTLCLGGLAAVLAGRLGVAVEGTVGVLAESFEALLPRPPAAWVRDGLLVNRATALLLAGDEHAAATLPAPVGDGPEGTASVLPGLTSAELSLLLGQAPALVPGGGDGPRPPADRELPACRARSARGAVVTGDDLHRSVADALAAAGSVVSPLEQGLTRVVVGRRLIAAGALRAGEQHLRAAAGLFEGCGADALASLARAGHGPLATLAAVGASAVAPAWAEPLTEREREVARVIAAGASNRLAARQLLVSSRTIEVHLTNIFRKLGVRSRTELALLVTRSDD